MYRADRVRVRSTPAVRLSRVVQGSVAAFTALCGRLLAVAHAEPPAAPPSAVRANTYSTYEAAAIKEALSTYQTEIDRAPEGKTLEGIDIITLDVFEPRDPVPTFFDVFHTTSKRTSSRGRSSSTLATRTART